jgi:hypothetical protein
MKWDTTYADRPPRRNAFAGVCVCGKEVAARAGWVWIGGVYCRHPEKPGVCPNN